MSGERVPKVGEVWTRGDGATGEVVAVHGGRVAYVLRSSTPGGALDLSLVYVFTGRYRPPAEPWEHPEPVERWAAISPLGGVGQGLMDAHMAEAHAWEVGWPAICKVRIWPIEGTVRRVTER